MSSWVPSLFINDAPNCSSKDAILGIKKDLEEIKGSFKSGLSLISSKITSNFLKLHNSPPNDDDDDADVSEDEDIVGINEEVVDFVRKISGRPQLWTEFPLLLPPDGFDLSDYQREHAACIDKFVPELLIMKQKICSQISNGKFWLIYFILLFSRLSEEDLVLLSTPEVVEAREILLKKLQNKSNLAQATSENPDSSDTNEDMLGDQSTSQNRNMSAETVNSTTQRDIVHKTESGNHSEEVETTLKHSEEADISFTDLEDDNNDSPRHNGSESNKVSRGESDEWIRVKENSAKLQAGKSGWRDRESDSEDSNEWLTVDDSDFDSLEEI